MSWEERRETVEEGGSEHVSDFREDLVERWSKKYLDVEIVRVEGDRVWLYAHNTHAMIVKEYGVYVAAGGSVSLRGRLVYCGPAIIRGPRGFYIFLGGKLAEVVDDLSIIQDVLIRHIGRVARCFDVDIGEEVAAKIPAQKATAILIAARSPFQTSIEAIDWAQGRDLMGLLRSGDPDPQGFKAREAILKKYYGENYYPALALESLYIAAALVHELKKASKTATASWIYSYGQASLGKSILAKNLVEMWCASEECEDAYMPYVAGTLNENRLRNALDIEGPAFIADEQDRESVVKLLKMLGSATSDIIGVHAAKYGRGFGAVFKVRRGIVIITNVPASDAVSRVDGAVRDAVKRRLLVIPWAAQKMDKDTARQLLQELWQYTPPALPFVSLVYAKCKEKLLAAADVLELAKTFWTCASEVFGVDYSERVRALEWVERVQGEEKSQREYDELEELWRVVKEHYRVADDKEALLRLLDDRTVVEYTERGSSERWSSVFRRICGRGIDTVKPTEAFTEIATCMYNIHIESMDMAEKLLNKVDVELIKKIAAIKASGRYLWVKAPSWLIPHRKREVAGVQHVRDPMRNIYRYDLVAEFLVMLYTSKEEEDRGDANADALNTDQNESVTTITTITTGSSQETYFNSPPMDGEIAERVTASVNLENPGSNCSNSSNTSESTDVSQTASLVKDEEGYSRCVKEVYKRHKAAGLDHAAALREAIRECL